MYSCGLWLAAAPALLFRSVQVPSVPPTSLRRNSLHNLTVPELSPSDPTGNASSQTSSAPVIPLHPPPFAATQADRLVHGKHQPDPSPRPFRPVPTRLSIKEEKKKTMARACRLAICRGSCQWSFKLCITGTKCLPRPFVDYLECFPSL
jgi:hypothetical protein